MFSQSHDLLKLQSFLAFMDNFGVFEITTRTGESLCVRPVSRHFLKLSQKALFLAFRGNIVFFILFYFHLLHLFFHHPLFAFAKTWHLVRMGYKKSIGNDLDGASIWQIIVLL